MGPFEPSSRGAAREIGRYVLFGEIAAGGMATVHYGRLSGPVGFSRTVAIKRLHPQFAKDPEFVTMFLDEARLAGRIRHPNVVPTLDVVATEGEIFLVMEYVQGESLARLIRAVKTQNVRAPDRILATIMSGVLHGLHSAHEAKDEQGRPLSIVHRDVSPQNVLVGTDGVARVLDFGVAKAAGRLQSTREGQIKGKISYMAPEQLNGATVTRATDIYAASVVLWESYVGQRLYEGDNEAMVVVRALEGKVEPPSKFVKDLPADLDAVIMKGLSKNPADRYATARDMALALEKAVGISAPSEVGEWVEAIAGHELIKRAQTIAEIESSSISSVHLGNLVDQMNRPSTPDMDDQSARNNRTGGGNSHTNETVSQVSTISVSRSGLPEGYPGRRRKGPLVALGIALFALCGALVVVFALLSRAESAGPAATGDAVDARAAVGSSPVPMIADSTHDAVDAAVALTNVPDAAAIAVIATAHVLPSGPHPNAPVRPPPVRPPTTATGPTPTSASAPPAKNCDPPYTVDADGHKKYKMECL